MTEPYRAPLTASQIEERLDEPLDAVLSSRRTAAAPSAALARFSRGQQDFVLERVTVIARTNAELAYQFVAHAPRALAELDEDGVGEWILAALDVYDRDGLYPGSAVFEDVAGFAARRRDRAHGMRFEEVGGVLARFLRGLSGRELKLEPDVRAWTDTGTVYLPEQLALFASRQDNYRLYKAMAGHLWAQTRYGSFAPGLAEALGRFPDPARAARLYGAAEAMRLGAVLERELPGLARDMRALTGQAAAPPWPPQWRERAGFLARPQACAVDSLESVRLLYDAEEPAPLCFQGEIDAVRVAETRAARVEREQREFRRRLQQLLEESAARAPAGEARRFDVRRTGRGDGEAGGDLELLLDGQPLAAPPEVGALMDSIVQDLGAIPPGYLVPAGDGGLAPADGASAERRAGDAWKGSNHEEGAFLYNEWDHRRQHYRKNWCVLREIDVHPRPEPFVEQALQRHAGLARALRRTFEILRGEDRLLKRQAAGDNVDLDALVEGLADASTGREMSERLFTRKRKLERDIAVMFMVDMSGSTKGWINDAEREALALLCEALEVLGDRYAIYGFSGMTRKRCELYRIKRFDETYTDLVRARISGIRPQDYTRMGVAIRHLTGLLAAVEARTRLLITLSDGRPDDYDGYRGDYGIEDTRQALIEAKRAGIHPFCITIDREARDYLPHMYGAVNYTVVDDIARLPFKVSDIYRRLTA